jgi:hypothetical protein
VLYFLTKLVNIRSYHFKGYFLFSSKFFFGEYVLKPRSPWKILLLSPILFLFFTTPCQAIDAELTWDASADADYYVVYWGTSPGAYSDSSGNITGITYDFSEPDDTYYIAVKAFNTAGESVYSQEVCVLGPTDPELGTYNKGWGITSGAHNGFKVLYNDPPGPTPTLGPSSAIPPIPNVDSVGLPLNLQPSGVDFVPPVTIFLPCPTSDVSSQNIYYWNGAEWILANDANDSDNVLPDATGWMVAGTRVDHDIVPPYTVEFQVNHFSGAQAGVPASTSSEGGGGGCFIATAGFGFEDN